jgi:hypothetical protein
MALPASMVCFAVIVFLSFEVLTAKLTLILRIAKLFQINNEK